MFPGVVRRLLKLVPTLLQAVALVVIVHVVGQGLIQRYGGAKYRFTKSYQSALSGGDNKVQKVIKYIDKNIPRYQPKKGGLWRGASSTASTTSTTPAPPPPLKQLRAEQRQRLARLANTCTRHNLGNYKKNNTAMDRQIEKEAEAYKLNMPYRPLWQNLYCSEPHKITLCPVFKSASTFLLKKFLMLVPSGLYNKETVKQLDGNANSLARKEFGYLKTWDLYPEFTSKGMTIMFVRHPFERLLSAFRDKLEDPAVKGYGRFNEYYYNKYGRRVVRYYRTEKVTGPTSKFPRFHEFINYLLDKDMRYDDEHWMPFYKSCTPCMIDFSFIGKFETLYWDMHLLANLTNLTDRWDDPTDYFQSSTYRDVSKRYYGTVDRDQIRRLVDRYRLDFQLFGYSPDEYIEFGKPSLKDIEREEEERKKEEEKRRAEEQKYGIKIMMANSDGGEEVESKPDNDQLIQQEDAEGSNYSVKISGGNLEEHKDTSNVDIPQGDSNGNTDTHEHDTGDKNVHKDYMNVIQ